MYDFRCNLCDAEIQADESYVGQALVCPLCSGAIIMPDLVIQEGTDFLGYSIQEHFDSNLLWNSYYAAGIEKVRRKTVIIRIPSTFFLRNVSTPERFYDTVVKSGTLNLPEFPALIDRSILSDKVYFTFEHLEGYRHLSEFIFEHRIFEYLDSLNILRTCAVALKKAWEGGAILHQNIIPGNICINEAGDVQILNVGIYDFLLKDYTLLENGFNVWDSRYMSPEFVKHGKADSPSCDIYSLGGILHVLLTGRHPYENVDSESIPDLPVPNPSICDPTVPELLVKLLYRLMDKEPTRRLSSWDQVIVEIDTILPKFGGQKTPTIMSLTGISFKDIEVGTEMEHLRGKKSFAIKKKVTEQGEEGEYKSTDTIARLKPSKMKVKSISNNWDPSQNLSRNRQKNNSQIIIVAVAVLITLAMLGILLNVKNSNKKSREQMIKEANDKYYNESNNAKKTSATTKKTDPKIEPAKEVKPKTEPDDETKTNDPEITPETPKPAKVEEAPIDTSKAQGLFESATRHLQKNPKDYQGTIKILEQAQQKAQDEKDFVLEQAIQQEIYNLEDKINPPPKKPEAKTPPTTPTPENPAKDKKEPNTPNAPK